MSIVEDFNPAEDQIEIEWTDAPGGEDPVLTTEPSSIGIGTVLLIDGTQVATFEGVTSIDTSTVVIQRAA